MISLLQGLHDYGGWFELFVLQVSRAQAAIAAIHLIYHSSR